MLNIIILQPHYVVPKSHKLHVVGGLNFESWRWGTEGLPDPY